MTTVKYKISEGSIPSLSEAGSIRGWNVFWGILGGYEVAAGSINLANGYGVGAVDVAIGGVCIGVIPTREAKRRMWMADGVKKYNSALNE